MKIYTKMPKVLLCLYGIFVAVPSFVAWMNMKYGDVQDQHIGKKFLFLTAAITVVAGLWILIWPPTYSIDINRKRIICRRWPRKETVAKRNSRLLAGNSRDRVFV